MDDEGLQTEFFGVVPNCTSSTATVGGVLNDSALTDPDVLETIRRASLQFSVEGCVRRATG